MIVKFYINTKDQLDFIERKGWKSLTVCKLLHKIGLSTEDIKKKGVLKSMLSNRYCWKTEDQYNIIIDGLIYWWLSSKDLSNSHYIPDNEKECAVDKKYRLNYFSIDKVIMRVVRDTILRNKNDETSDNSIPFIRF